MFLILLVIGLVLLAVGFFNSRALAYAGAVLIALALVILLVNNLDAQDVETSLKVLLQ